MSAHMKMHPIKKESIEVILKYQGKKPIHAFIPIESAGRFEAILSEYEESESVDWRVVAKDSLTKHKKAGIVLRGARGRENMTQKELAKRSGVSQENISRIENGRRTIGEKLAKKLAKPLKINYLLLMEEDA
jgi:ribosome-binding protein aMBF1 (putative translation factor)